MLTHTPVDTQPTLVLTGEEEAAIAQSIGDSLRRDIGEHFGPLTLLFRKKVVLYVTMQDAFIQNWRMRRQQCAHTCLELPHENEQWRHAMRDLVEEALEGVVTDLGIPFQVEAVELVDIDHAYSIADYTVGAMHSIMITLSREQ